MASEKRVPVTFRLSPSRRSWLDKLAYDHHTDMSVVVRAALAVADKHMPELSAAITRATEQG